MSLHILRAGRAFYTRDNHPFPACAQVLCAPARPIHSAAALGPD